MERASAKSIIRPASQPCGDVPAALSKREVKHFGRRRSA